MNEHERGEPQSCQESDGCPTEIAVLQREWRRARISNEQREAIVRKAVAERDSVLAGAPQKLWLWKNFVDGKPEYWAFDNPYPTRLDCGDPQTLGQPCGYALFKPSRDGSAGRTEEQVLREMASVASKCASRPVGALSLSDEQLVGAIARGWCHPANSSKEMDADLAGAICEEVRAILAASAPAPTDDEIRAAWNRTQDPIAMVRTLALAPAVNALSKPALDPATVEACAKECERASSGYWSQLFANRIRALASAPAVPQAAPKMVLLTESEIDEALAPYVFHDRFGIVPAIQRAFAAKNGLEIDRLIRAAHENTLSAIEAPAVPQAAKVRDLRDVQAASVGTDPYMRGLYNGLELALTVMEDRDPIYMEGPVKTDALHSVLAERQRQIMHEGWTHEHDDKHKGGEMALAAACYAAHTGAALSIDAYELKSEGGLRLVSRIRRAQEYVAGMWPWAREWWKPKDRRRNLVRAGALILAEIERLDRAAAEGKQ